jgi:hypothetical protein
LVLVATSQLAEVVVRNKVAANIPQQRYYSTLGFSYGCVLFSWIWIMMVVATKLLPNLDLEDAVNYKDQGADLDRAKPAAIAGTSI